MPAGDFVEWCPRRYNSMADHIAGLCIRNRGPINRSFGVVCGPSEWKFFNWLLCVDGGFVRGVGGATGMVLFKMLPDGDKERVADFSIFLPRCRSAFEAEAIALETALEKPH